MKRTFWMILLGVLVFAGIVISRLPAGWVMPDPKSGVACSDVDGTIWSGSCTGLIVQQLALGDLTWDIHPMRLLAGKLNTDLVLTRPDGTSHGNVEVGMGQKITARDIEADLPLDHALIPAVDAGIHGKLHAQIASLRFEKNAVRSIAGVIEAHDIVDSAGGGLKQLGSYSVTFPPDVSGDPVGQLKDLGGGPLEVKGSLKLTSNPPGFDLEGLVKPLAGAAPDLVQTIQFFGRPDAEGFRPFGLQNTF
jgi:general secretion pathway protein N